MQQRHNHKKGFSLVEAAIVLAVVGLVVAGIWVAASSVSENQKIATFEKDMLIIVRNMQHVVSKRDSSALGEGENLNSLAHAAKIFPDNWVNNHSDEWAGFHTPWDGDARITSFSPGVAWDGFRVYFFQFHKGRA